MAKEGLRSALLSVELVGRVIYVAMVGGSFFSMVQVRVVFASVFFSNGRAGLPIPSPDRVVRDFYGYFTRVQGSHKGPIVICQRVRRRSTQVRLVRVEGFLLARFTSASRAICVLRGIRMVSITFMNARSLSVI